MNLVSLISMCFYDDHDMFFVCKICLCSTEERDSENPKQRGSFLLFLLVFMFLMTIQSLKSTRSTWRFLLLSITIKTRACWAEVAFVLTANSGEKQKSRGDKYSEFHYSQALGKAGKAQFTGGKMWNSCYEICNCTTKSI